MLQTLRGVLLRGYSMKTLRRIIRDTILSFREIKITRNSILKIWTRLHMWQMNSISTHLGGDLVPQV